MRSNPPRSPSRCRRSSTNSPPTIGTPRPGRARPLAWDAYSGDEPLSVGDLSAYDRLDEETPAQSIVLHPIGDHGLFVISSSEPHAFTETDVLIAEILANHLEAALDRVARETSLERLHDATRSLIQADSPKEIAERVVEVLGFSVVTVRLSDEDAGGSSPSRSRRGQRGIARAEGVHPRRRESQLGGVRGGRTPDVRRHRDGGRARHWNGAPEPDDPPRRQHGTISVGETEPGVFDGTDEHLAQILATAAETALNAAARTSRLHDRSAELERQNDRLAEFASVVSHDDLRNPLNVAQGRVQLARDECDSENLDAAARAHERMDTLIADLLTLAREGERVSETESVRLSVVVESCWETVETANATLAVEEDLWPGRREPLQTARRESGAERGRTRRRRRVDHCRRSRREQKRQRKRVRDRDERRGRVLRRGRRARDPGSEPRRGVRRRLLDLARGDRLRPPDRRTGGDGPRLVGPGHGGSRRGRARFEDGRGAG